MGCKAACRFGTGSQRIRIRYALRPRSGRRSEPVAARGRDLGALRIQMIPHSRTNDALTGRKAINGADDQRPASGTQSRAARGTTSQVSPSADAVSTSPDLGRSDHTTDTPVVVDLSLDPERIAARVFAAVPPEKAYAIAKSINQRLAVWRCGSFDLRLVQRR